MNINYVLTRGVSEILPDKKGLTSLMTKKKIRLYQGFDPTSQSLHIGHMVAFRKLAQFQKLGHKVIFLIGDGTGQAGDPSDKDKTREKFLSKKILQENSKNYKKQAGRFLDFEGKNAAQILYNSEWLNKLGLVDILSIAENFSVQQLIERDMFQRRIENNQPINLREFLYPLLQGYDSVYLDIDLEIGGSDQLFNMLAGRTLVKILKKREKYVLTTRLLTDSGGKKMGKTEGNAVNLSDSASDIYGKIMSWPDTLIDSSIELLTDLPLTTRKERGELTAKKLLAFEVVTQVYDEGEAREAQEQFEKHFQNREPEFKKDIVAQQNLLETISPLVKSKTEAKRLITSGGVDVNGQKIRDIRHRIYGGEKIKMGKKIFVRVTKLKH